MLKSFFEGMLFLGLPMLLFVGPAFFALLQTSIQRGVKAGVFLAFGISLSDATLVAISYLGAYQFLTTPENQVIAGIIASAILFAFGVYNITRKMHIDEHGKVKDNPIGIKTLGPFTYILKGYFLNIVNPFLLIFWMSMVGAFSSNYDFNSKTIISFFVKCFAARKIKNKFLKPKTIFWINKIMGFLMIGFGLFYIIKVIVEFI